MIELLSAMQGVLQEAGFVTHLISVDRSSIVCFEDETLTGFGCVFDEPESLLARWRALEMSFLMRFAPDLRLAGQKAWNVYCVFLCGLAADPIHDRQVRWIEEDLDRTRKVAACGLVTREDLAKAMLPLLPIQHQPVLKAEDVTERLRTRVRSIAPKAVNVVLDETVLPGDVVRLLAEPA